MIYPNLTNLNARYRGPIESKKINFFNNQIEYNIKLLYKEFENLYIKFNELENILSDNYQYKTNNDLFLLGRKIDNG